MKSADNLSNARCVVLMSLLAAVASACAAVSTCSSEKKFQNYQKEVQKLEYKRALVSDFKDLFDYFDNIDKQIVYSTLHCDGYFHSDITLSPLDTSAWADLKDELTQSATNLSMIDPQFNFDTFMCQLDNYSSSAQSILKEIEKSIVHYQISSYDLRKADKDITCDSLMSYIYGIYSVISEFDAESLAHLKAVDSCYRESKLSLKETYKELRRNNFE